MARTASVNNKSIQKTANATEELVKLNKETGKQTKIIIVLTIVIAILTFILSIPIIMKII